jgi:hypothetical protein
MYCLFTVQNPIFFVKVPSGDVYRMWRNQSAKTVAELPELFQLKCLSHASGAVTHLNRNNLSVPQI